jgi:hypothetical protein
MVGDLFVQGCGSELFSVLLQTGNAAGSEIRAGFSGNGILSLNRDSDPIGQALICERTEAGEEIVGIDKHSRGGGSLLC